MHKMKLREIYYNLIKKGEKIYEIRLNDEKRQILDVGDMLVFEKEPNLDEKLNTVIEDLIYFKSFNEMLNCLPLEKVGFKNSSINEVEKVYRQFYTIDDEKKYGIVAIKVKTIK